MMTGADFEILTDSGIRRLIAENLDRDPAGVAMRVGGPYAALVATQVKYLQRARRKLPSYCAAQCILPPRAFEQASSEASAGRMEFSGDWCVDLTCGLGVDAWALSRRFRRVVAVERDPVMAAVAAYNFGLLGANHIEVVTGSAEEFLERWRREGTESPPDLIYLDPDRRDAGERKRVTLEALSPDVGALLPRLRLAAQQVVVKLSPLFDVEEAVRVFGPACRVEVVSEEGGCKQVVVETGQGIDGPLIRATVIGRQPDRWSVEYPAEAVWACHAQGNVPVSFNQLIVPDVALQKARLVRRYFGERGMYAPTENGFVFAADPDTKNLCHPLSGRAYAIERIEPFRPKALKTHFKKCNIRRITLLKRDFPHSAAEILNLLNISEGSDALVAFTVLDGERVAVRLKVER